MAQKWISIPMASDCIQQLTEKVIKLSHMKLLEGIQGVLMVLPLLTISGVIIH